MKRISINGFGRASLKVIIDTPRLEVIAINDLMSIGNAAYLLTYESIYGKYHENVIIGENHMFVNNKKIVFFPEKDPAKLPWKGLNIDVLVQ